MSNINVISDATSSIGRFKISGTIIGIGTATNNVDAAKSVNQALDTLMTNLKKDRSQF